MAQTKMQAGAVIETVTPQELKTHLDQYTQDWYQEKARGVTDFRFADTATPATGSLTIPAVGAPNIGPRQGYAWLVQSIRCAGLLSGDSVSVYRNSVVDTNLVAVLTSGSPVASFGSKGLIYRGDEKMLFSGSGLMATGSVSVNGEGVELPEVDIYKVL